MRSPALHHKPPQHTPPLAWQQPRPRQAGDTGGKGGTGSTVPAPRCPAPPRRPAPRSRCCAARAPPQGSTPRSARVTEWQQAVGGLQLWRRDASLLPRRQQQLPRARAGTLRSQASMPQLVHSRYWYWHRHRYSKHWYCRCWYCGYCMRHLGEVMLVVLQEGPRQLQVRIQLRSPVGCVVVAQRGEAGEAGMGVQRAVERGHVHARQQVACRAAVGQGGADRGGLVVVRGGQSTFQYRACWGRAGKGC